MPSIDRAKSATTFPSTSRVQCCLPDATSDEYTIPNDSAKKTRVLSRLTAGLLNTCDPIPRSLHFMLPVDESRACIALFVARNNVVPSSLRTGGTEPRTFIFVSHVGFESNDVDAQPCAL